MEPIEVCAVVYEMLVVYGVSTTISTIQHHAKVQEILDREHQSIAALAHHLQTPVTVLFGQLQLIEHGQPVSNEAVKQSLSRIAECVQQVLYLSRFESSIATHTFCTVNFSKLVEAQVEYIDIMARESSVAVTGNVTSNVYIVGCIQLLEQMIIALAHNAIKYRCDDRLCRICISLHERRSFARFVIADTGTGIPEQDIPYIFDRFYRCAQSKEKEGHGLGLALVKHVVEAHHAAIEVDSTYGVGTKITIVFPVCKTPPCGDVGAEG